MDSDSLLQVVVSHCLELDNTDPNRNLLLMVRNKYFCLKFPGVQCFLDAPSFLSTNECLGNMLMALICPAFWLPGRAF